MEDAFSVSLSLLFHHLPKIVWLFAWLIDWLIDVTQIHSLAHHLNASFSAHSFEEFVLFNPSTSLNSLASNWNLRLLFCRSSKPNSFADAISSEIVHSSYIITLQNATLIDTQWFLTPEPKGIIEIWDQNHDWRLSRLLRLIDRLIWLFNEMKTQQFQESSQQWKRVIFTDEEYASQRLDSLQPNGICGHFPQNLGKNLLFRMRIYEYLGIESTFPLVRLARGG
jgi:hypothetical protein